MSATTLERPRFGSLFSGIGGLDLAIEEFFDAEIVWHAEFDPEPSKVLEARWPGVENLGDVTTIDWDQVEPVDGLCGGFPCQDLSLAGRRSGMRPGTRSGLWADFKAAIAALRPSVVVIENVRGLLSGCAESDSDLEPCPGCLGISNVHRPLVRALGRVLGDLAELGFDAEWEAVRASDVGAQHGRFRVFVVAYAQGVGLERGWPARGRWGGSADGGFGAPVGRLFDTPDTMPEAPNSGSHRKAQPAGLWNQVKTLLGTPTTRDWKDGGEVAGVNVNGLLGRQVWNLLPTPVAQPSGNTPENHLRKKPGRGVVTDLAILVENDLLETGGRLPPTPKAHDGEFASPSTSGRPVKKSTHLTTIAMLTAGQLEHRRLLPTPRVAAQRSSKSAMLGPSSSSMSIEQAVEVAQGILPREFDSWEQVGVEPGDGVAWGAYELAVRRWEALTRPAPAPTLPDGKNDAHRLNARLPEWMMGYPGGWVTDILERNAAIKACGNGVVPQQAVLALSLIWPRVLDALSEAVAA